MKRTMRIMRFGVLSVAFRGLIIGATIGFILGVAAAFWWAMFASALTIASGIDLTGAGYAILVLLPLGGMVALGSLWMCVAFLTALVYNLTAGLFGGVPVEVAEVESSPPMVPDTVSKNTDENLPSPDEPLLPDSDM